MNWINYLRDLHPVIIHFPIAGYVLSLFFALGSVISIKTGKFKPSNLLTLSLVNFWIATFFYPLAVLTGLIDAGSFSHAFSIDLLAVKIVLGTFTFFVLFATISIIGKDLFHSNDLLHHHAQYDTYLVFVFLINILITVIATLGGIYVFNHSLFDLFGLRFILPTSINQPTSANYPNILETIFYSPEMTPILLVLFIAVVLMVKRIQGLLMDQYFNDLVTRIIHNLAS